MQSKAKDGELWVCRGNYDADLYFPTAVHQFKWQRVSIRYGGAESTAAKRNLTVLPNPDVRP